MFQGTPDTPIVKEIAKQEVKEEEKSEKAESEDEEEEEDDEDESSSEEETDESSSEDEHISIQDRNRERAVARIQVGNHGDEM